MKTCTQCGLTKPLDGFNRDKRRADGLTAGCKACRASRCARYRLAHPERVKANWDRWKARNGDHLKARAVQRRLEKRAEVLVANARLRARKKGLDFDLDAADHLAELRRRIASGHCELTGTRLDLSPGRTFASPSLDRREPAKGYVIENVRVVCHGFNAAMGDWGEDVLLQLVAGYLAKRDAIDVEAFTNLIAAYLDCAPVKEAA